MENRHTKKRKNIIFIASLLISILMIPTSLLVVGFSSFHPFEKTYYAALKKLINRLDSSKKKKILILGTSSVAFSVNGKLFEEELEHVQLDYDVVPFGLYGSLGTKLMMELSKDRIQEGDIVLFSPELTSQTLSSYFSAKETYRSFDGNLNWINRLDSSEKKKMALGFPAFASEKYSYIKKNEMAVPSGVYALDSFDENGDLTYQRDFNIMENYYDSNTVIDLEDISIEEEFMTYVRSFAKEVRNRKASIYFHYAPTNRAALKSETDDIIQKANRKIQDSFQMEVIGNPHDAFLDKEYFYDTNFHLNSIGSFNYTLELSSEIKSLFDITLPGKNQKAEKPDLPKKPTESKTYNNTDSNGFLYEKEGEGYTITGLSEEGKKKSYLTIPGQYLSKPVLSISQSALQNQKNIKEITIQENIKTLRDGMFEGSSIEKIHLRQKDPTKISVGFRLFSTSGSQILVPTGSLTSYLANYSWSYYSQYLLEENL